MKVNVATRVEEAVAQRIEKLCERANRRAGVFRKVSASAVIEQCIIKHLPALEREVLGEQFAGKPAEAEVVA